MKVLVHVVDTLKGISQSGTIDEPVVAGSEIRNALSHFGVIYAECSIITSSQLENGMQFVSGKVDEADVYFTVISY